MSILLNSNSSSMGIQASDKRGTKENAVVASPLKWNWSKIAPLCMMIHAVGGCDITAKPGSSARIEQPLEIQGYKLGMSERAVLEHGNATCHNPSGMLDADRICSISVSVSGQPALLFFYFFDSALEKLALTVLPNHGQLSEVCKLFSGEFETKYGKPSTDNTSTLAWSQKSGSITISRGDERTVTVNLTSEKYENEKARRAKNAGRGIEI